MEHDVNKRIGFGKPARANCRRTTCTVAPSLPNVHLTPRQVVLLVRGFVNGEPSTILAAELGFHYNTVLELWHDLQDNARWYQPRTALVTAILRQHPRGTRCFRMRGKKEVPTLTRLTHLAVVPTSGVDEAPMPNDRPPIVGTIGRQSGQVRLRVVHDMTGATLCAHVHCFTQSGTQLYTDENNGYNHVIRSHANREYARDDDGDGIREVHCNTVEGMWTDVRNFLPSLQRCSQKVSRRLCGDD